MQRFVRTKIRMYLEYFPSGFDERLLMGDG